MTEEDVQAMTKGQRFLHNHRRAIGFIIPVCIWQFFWWAMFFDRGFWQEQYFPTKYPLSVTMIAGGTIAGKQTPMGVTFSLWSVRISA